MLGRNVAGTRGLGFPRVLVADDLQPHAVWVGKAEHFFLKSLAGAFHRNSRGQQALLPELQRWARDTECSGGSFSYPQAAARGMRPGKEGKNGSRRPGIVSKVEVIGSRIVKVDGALYKTKPQHLGVEVEIALRVRSNRCDVMQADNGFWHGVASSRV